MPQPDAPHLPLSGIRVLDLTSIVLGPLATLCLADLGAEIIKLERPEGDAIRTAGAFVGPGLGPIFLALNRNKFSVVLDLQRPDARGVLARLVAHADVVVHNMRPAAARKLGIDYPAVQALNPAAIYCSASGYHPQSDRADDPAVDDAIQAHSGLAALLGSDGAAPAYVPNLLADKICGLLMAQSVMAGLMQRERTGKGGCLHVSMADVMAAFTLYEHLGGATRADCPGPMGYNRVLSPHRRPLATRDGHVALTPYSLRDWQAFLRAAGAPALAEDPRITDPQRRNRDIGQLYALLADLVAALSTAEVLDIARRAGVPVAPVRGLEAVLSDLDLAASGTILRYQDPRLGQVHGIGPLVRFVDAPVAELRPAPDIGADTRRILQEIGYSPAELQELGAAGVLV